MGQGTVEKEVLDLSILIYSVVVLVIIAFTIIIFFVVFQKRKNLLLIDKLKQEQEFEEELVKTQQEIQEDTLAYIGRELHDNVGQMLVMSTMSMNAAAKVVTDEAKVKVDTASKLLKETLTEVRALSKSLNSDVIFNLGFETTIKNEIERLNRIGTIEATFKIVGDKVDFENKKDEIILFRMLQEFSSNTLKYSEAENLNITLSFDKDNLEICATDDGIGFDMDSAEKGSGLINMKKRAELINAEFELESQPEKGTRLHLIYPYRTF